MKKRALLLAFLAVFIYTTEAANINIDNTRTITSTGHGEVEIPQKIALISLTINKTAKKPQDAQEQARQAFDQVLSAVKQIPALTIYSSMVMVAPNWSYADNQSKIIGYSANYSIQVKSTITNSGAIIDKAIANGASIVGNPQLLTTDKDKAEAELQAIKLATQDARAKAEASLSALDIKSKFIRQITIQNNNPAPRPMPMANMAMMKSNVDNNIPVTEIISGMDTVSADVTLVSEY